MPTSGYLVIAVWTLTWARFLSPPSSKISTCWKAGPVPAAEKALSGGFPPWGLALGTKPSGGPGGGGGRPLPAGGRPGGGGPRGRPPAATAGQEQERRGRQEPAHAVCDRDVVVHVT